MASASLAVTTGSGASLSIARREPVRAVGLLIAARSRVIGVATASASAAARPLARADGRSPVWADGRPPGWAAGSAAGWARPPAGSARRPAASARRRLEVLAGRLGAGTLSTMVIDQSSWPPSSWLACLSSSCPAISGPVSGHDRRRRTGNRRAASRHLAGRLGARPWTATRGTTSISAPTRSPR